MSFYLENFMDETRFFFKYTSLYYIILIAFVALGFILYKKSNLKHKDAIYIGGVFLVMFCLSAFRFDVGFDYFYGYVPIWRRVLATPFSNWKSIGVEPGFIMLNYFIKIFTDHFQGIFIVTSFIIVGLLCLFIYKYFPSKIWGVFLIFEFGLFFDTMCVIRQGIALGLVIFAVMFARKKQIVPYMLLVLLAATFHKSALIMIPIYFVLQIKLSKKLLYVYSGITLFILVFSREILGIVTKYFYSRYDANTGSVYTNVGAPWFFFIPSIIYFAIIYHYRDKILKNNENNWVLINCAFIDMFLYLVSAKHFIIARLNMFFDPINALTLTILITELIKEKNENKEDKKIKKRFNFVNISLIAVVLFFGLKQLNYDSSRVVPYQTIFGNEEYQRYCQAVEENDMEYIEHYEKQFDL